MLSPALVQKYDLSIRGGGEKMKIAASLGFLNRKVWHLTLIILVAIFL